MLTLDKIYYSARLLKDVAVVTDILKAPKLSNNCQLYLKMENLQLTGSFKVRGAYCKIAQLSDDEKKKGVIACSAGNHAQGVALSAQQAGISSMICLPDGAPISKIEATRRYGAQIVRVDGGYDEAYKRAKELQKETGRVFIHPFDDVYVIAGQGTIGLEIVTQLPDVDAVIVPIGGGGLISGVAYALKSVNPKIKVYGVQAAGAPSMLKSIKHGKIGELESAATIADGIAVKRPGENTYEICNRYVDGIATVNDDEISTAILSLLEDQKVVTEGAGAVSVAAVLFNKFPIEGKKVVAILSGGNIDVSILSKIITRGLIKTGRTANLTISILDQPGELQKVCGIISAHRANIISIYHNRVEKDLKMNSCFLEVVIETRDTEHIETISQALNKAGYDVLQD